MNFFQRNGNRIASALLIVALVAIVAWTWYDSPARRVDHTIAENPAMVTPEALEPLHSATPPQQLRPLWQTNARAKGVAPAPLVFGSVTIAVDDHGVRGLDTLTGQQRWNYSRDVALCAASKSNDHVVLTFESESGCGETVSLDPATGAYAATRRSLAPDDVTEVRSNSYAGVYSNQFVELWRDDLVRVVEYGNMPAPSEINLQPHPNCSIVDALTRLDLLAVVNDCDGQARLVFQDAVPDESRKPEISAEVDLGAAADDVQLVAIGADAAVIRRGDVVTAYRQDGTRLSSTNVAQAVEEEQTATNAAANADSPQPPADSPKPPAALPMLDIQLGEVFTADLPHQMTWLSPHGLVGFNPNNLDFAFVRPDAIGTGDGWDDFLIYPTADGVSVANVREPNNLTRLPLPTAAPSQGAPVSMRLAGSTLLIQRGETLSAYELVF